jgi:hypothetical protein
MALLVLAVALNASVASAQDVMASRFGNTTISRDASGVESRIYYAADGKFTGTQSGQTFSGSWKVDGGNLCLTADHPAPGAPSPACAPIAAHNVGDSWTDGAYTVSLVAGIR